MSSRRAILGAGLVILSRPWLPAFAGDGPSSDATEIEAVRSQAEAAGLGPIESVESRSYLVVGDAKKPFLQAASRLCEDLSRDYLGHFRSKLLDVHAPERRLTVVALADPDSYARFLGVRERAVIGGQFDLSTNRLVIFDNRARADAGPQVERANTVTLLHEATHQLTFNTGLLDPKADVPKAVSEGLAMYGEVRRPDGRLKIGAVNTDRLAVLVQSRHAKEPWLTVSDLLRTDDLFDDPNTEQRAYAQAWLLIYYLMRGLTPGSDIRAYLRLVNSRKTPERRIEDGNSALGDLRDLDDELARSFASLTRR